MSALILRRWENYIGLHSGRSASVENVDNITKLLTVFLKNLGEDVPTQRGRIVHPTVAESASRA